MRIPISVPVADGDCGCCCCGCPHIKIVLSTIKHSLKVGTTSTVAGDIRGNEREELWNISAAFTLLITPSPCYLVCHIPPVLVGGSSIAAGVRPTPPLSRSR